MRRVVIGAFVSLDGVMQAPGGPEEDPTGDFRHGGWTAPYWDDTIAAAMGESFSQPFDTLLGRKTYDIFAAHWPHVEMDPKAANYDEGSAEFAKVLNSITKYVATHSPGTLSWENSEGLGSDVVARVRELKAGEGRDLVVQGSSELTQLLLANDLVDELRLLIYPVVLGRGKRLFGSDAAPVALRLVKSVISPSGVIIATYQREGEVKTGSFALPEPSQDEIERRKNMG